MIGQKGRTAAALLAGAALLAPAAALADTLQEALALAYQTNPTIQSARADLRANDENVPIEKSDGLPSIGGSAQYVEAFKQSSSSFTAPDRYLNAGVELSVPVYSGGSVKNSIRAAKERVQAGRADLKATESGIFAQVVAAYMDVIRDSAVVQLNQQNVETLQVNFRATSDRFEIGDLTRTDVAQSDSRLAISRSDLLTARSNLIGSRERYIQLVGKPPVALAPPPPLPGLPSGPDEAVDVALANNPDLMAARERSQAAKYDIEVAGATRLPRVELYTSGAYVDYFGTLARGTEGVSQSETTAQAGARLTVPIFQGGFPAALERQAQARAQSTMETEIAIERDVIAQTRAAYAAWIAANEVIEATTTAVSAASLSLEGVRAENTVGNRTILDILDAERELLSAQVQLVAAQRNAYVAGFSLLAAMGKAEAEDLNFDVGPLYDPVVHYDSVKSAIFDWRMEPDPVAQSTRTVDTPAQDADIQGE
ncbi:TolC family outer membrane protein [Croceicoccus bisphenolivorans]|uniref:TolC family outer membrane protein n=1 Tax=Croceicoccus bisphenolivorans TaxID=1783232 RepID=UPI00082BFD36|nr:TolC family outer membrane protein [Croceicoccus bisphenolivorans]